VHYEIAGPTANSFIANLIDDLERENQLRSGGEKAHITSFLAKHMIIKHNIKLRNL